MAYRYLSVECAIRKSSLHLQRVMLCELEICHAWTRVYDSICGDSNLASLTSCSANFVVTALQRTVNTVTTVALRPREHSSKVTSRLHKQQLSPYLSKTPPRSSGGREVPNWYAYSESSTFSEKPLAPIGWEGQWTAESFWTL